MALVVKTWRANSIEQDGEGNFVAIVCRQQGLIGFLLNALGVAPTTTIKVGGERIEFTSASLAGYSRRLIPLRGVCSTYYGFRRPVSQAIAVATIGLFLGGSIAGNVSGMVGAIIMVLGVVAALVYYLLNKKLTLGFVENSGAISGIQVKASLIEGKKIDETDAERVCQIIQNLIEARAI
jgi:hypothetical protein